MNDSLRYLGREPIYRQYHHHEMTFAMAYAYSENFILPISHDEVVHGKGSMYERVPQDEWRKFGTLRAFYAFMWSHPGKQLLFMGTEFGQRREFSEQRSIDWDQSAHWGHRGVQRLVKDLNEVYKDAPRDVQAGQRSRRLLLDRRRRPRRERLLLPALRRRGPDDRVPDQLLLRAAGGLPDRAAEGGRLEGDREHRRRVTTTAPARSAISARSSPIAVPSHGYGASASVTLPPLGAVWLLFEPVATEDTDDRESVEAGVRAAAKQASPRSKKAAATKALAAPTEPQTSADTPETTTKASRVQQAVESVRERVEEAVEDARDKVDEVVEDVKQKATAKATKKPAAKPDTKPPA